MNPSAATRQLQVERDGWASTPFASESSFIERKARLSSDPSRPVNLFRSLPSVFVFFVTDSSMQYGTVAGLVWLLVHDFGGFGVCIACWALVS